MKALALTLALAVPCMAQNSDIPFASMDAGVVCMPVEGAMLLAQDSKAKEAEIAVLKNHVQPAPWLVIVGAVVISLGVGIGAGMAIQANK
jgi:hypothetical protein